MDIIFLQTPIILVFAIIAICLCIIDKILHRVFVLQILSALSGTASILSAFFSGATVTELLVLVLLLLIFQLRIGGKRKQ